ncbi:MAG: zinc-dependent metalloprotease, partial [Thermoanaerobaculia bacterium]
MRRIAGAVLAAAIATAGALGAEDAGFAERTAKLEPRRGLLTLWVDDATGGIWLEVPPGAADGLVGEYLHVEGLVSGLGSNPVGLDRGQLGRTRRVRLRRVGGKLLLEQRNLGFRALAAEAAERRATVESFATSVLWAGPIESVDADGRGLVDLTPFLLRDVHDVPAAMAAANQGEFRLDPERSAVDLARCLAFPDNLELAALRPDASDAPGPLVRGTAASGAAVTLSQHHSFLRLPVEGYEPRVFDPRSGSFAVAFADYAAPLDEPIERRWIVRHRLARNESGAAVSAAREPIVYYVDPAIPEPVRGAVIEGAGWWARAFEAAGFRDAFRVEMLPEDAHPLDARYNVIQWVHRSTRGWSYGMGVVDPLTGERVKGHVNLGSLRVRQDRLIFEGLLGVGSTGTGRPDDPVELALARIRQLAAHEVGHTLGLAHNFAASTYGGRASVMDYPAPLIGLRDDGSFDVSRAYGVGVGEWDVQAIRYAYSEVADGAAGREELAAIVRDGIDRGLLFLSDADARPAGAAQPAASLWDNGDDPVAQLEHEMRVRRLALARFGQGNLAPGRPLALLQEVFATVYLRHRYQLEAAAKVVGGVDYHHALRGDGQPSARPLSAERQLRAVDALLTTLDPHELDIREDLLTLLLPRPYGYEPNRELFEHRTAPIFDALGAAATAADLTVAALLQPERAARLVDQHRRIPELPGLAAVLSRLTEAVFRQPAGESSRQAEIRATVQEVV